MKNLLPTETILIGEWISKDGAILENEVCKRIQWLIDNSFTEVAVLNWEAIYKDRGDSRYWLLTYPQSEMHGGGPPHLANITKEQVDDKQKYT